MKEGGFETDLTLNPALGGAKIRTEEQKIEAALTFGVKQGE